MNGWIYWNRRMWVFTLVLLQVACCDVYCAKQTFEHDFCSLLGYLVPFFSLGAAQSSPQLRTHGLIEENLGQTDGPYKFVLPGRGGAALFGDDAEVMLAGRKAPAVRFTLAAADKSRAEAFDLRETKVNYFIGNDASRWVRNASTYGSIRYRAVYPGIDMVFHGVSDDTGELEQDFILAQGADPKRIRMRFTGADKIEQTKSGTLKIHAGNQQIEWQAPVVYQRVDGGKRQVRSSYQLHPNGEISFELGSYRADRPLVIDPVISFSTFTGTAGNDMPGRLITDAGGNIYQVGSTNDYSYPSSAGAYSTNTAGAYDGASGAATITKLDPAASKVLFITHIGSTVQTFGVGLAVDALGAIYISGHTQGAGYPTTAGAFQTSLSASDPMAAFVTKLGPKGDQLLYSTYLSGANVDGATAIAVDSQGNAFVAGETNSTDFPVTSGAFQQGLRTSTTSGFNSDGFLAKLSPDGKKLLYGTYFGGNGMDLITSLAIDSKGNAFITGATTSTDLPTTSGAAATKFGGKSSNTTLTVGDAFVAAINPTGSALVYSTYLGGKQDDIAYSLALDAAGNAYVTGSTLSADFPVTTGAYQTTYKGAGGENNYPSGDAFVTKLDPTGALIYSTYLGGAKDDRAWVVAVDATGSAWIGGNTISTDFPLTSDAHQSAFGGLTQGQGLILGDAFVARLDPAGAKLLYSSYHGGSGNEAAVGLAFTADNSVLVSGTTSSRDLKTTAGVYEPRSYGGDPNFAPMLDGFLLKLAFAPPPPVVSISAIGNQASGVTGTVSPGMFVVINGANFSDQSLAADLTQASVPLILGQTQVLFDGGAAALISVSPQQIVAIVPYELQPGTTTQIVVNWNGVQSAAFSQTVAAASPGLYPNSILNNDSTPNSSANPAALSSTIAATGTGEGSINPAVVNGSIITADSVPAPVLSVSATLGGNDVTVSAVSSVVGQPAGQFQVQIVVPDQLDPGDYPLVIQVGGVPAPPVTVSIGSPTGTQRRTNRRR